MRTQKGLTAAASLSAAAIVVLFGCKDRAHDQDGQGGSGDAVAQTQLAAAPQPAPAVETNPQRTVASLPSLAPLVESVKRAVVNVDVKAKVNARYEADDPMSRFFGFGGGRQQAPVRQGSGSGFIIDKSGRVLTNNHVVEDAMEITVRLDDGRSFKGKVLGRDPLTDVALVQLEGVQGDLPTVTLGDSDSMRVGDYVVAIGNPFGLASSVSAGILSARAREITGGPYDDFLQTDAAINPGNSGGPLFNLRGEVIGINTAIIGGGTGIGFAVPSNMAKSLLPQLETGVVHRGFLGVGIQDLSADVASALNVPVKDGAVVTDVSEGTPAAKAGILPDDVIVAVDGKPVDSNRDVTKMIGAKLPGQTATLTLYRDGRKRDLKVTLAERPDLEGRMGGGPPQGNAQERSEKLGLSVADADGQMGSRGQSTSGAVIVGVAPGSRADDAGLAQGMVIVEAGGKPVRNAREFQSILSRAPSGKSLLLRVQVGDQKQLRALPVP